MKKVDIGDGKEKIYLKEIPGKWKVAIRENGEIIDVKTFYDRPYPFRKHKLRGGPLDGKTVEVSRHDDFYYPEQSDGSVLLYEASSEWGGEKKFHFNYYGKIKK